MQQILVGVRVEAEVLFDHHKLVRLVKGDPWRNDHLQFIPPTQEFLDVIRHDQNDLYVGKLVTFPADTSLLDGGVSTLGSIRDLEAIQTKLEYLFIDHGLLKLWSNPQLWIFKSTPPSIWSFPDRLVQKPPTNCPASETHDPKNVYVLCCQPAGIGL